MKKIAILLGLAASIAFLSGCANKSAQDAAVPSTSETAAPAHQDFKGEVGHTK